MKIRQTLLAGATTIAIITVAYAAETVALDHRLSVKEIMDSVITPATNTLWGIENPQTDADWVPYVEAAMSVMVAGTVLREGGAGETDGSRAADPRWRAFTDTMVNAAETALRAAREQDLEAFVEATNNSLYPPCEECHIAFMQEIR